MTVTVSSGFITTNKMALSISPAKRKLCYGYCRNSGNSIWKAWVIILPSAAHLIGKLYFEVLEFCLAVPYGALKTAIGGKKNISHQKFGNHNPSLRRMNLKTGSRKRLSGFYPGILSRFKKSALR